jgi:hypothetical protein
MDLKTYLDMLELYFCKSCAFLLGESIEDFVCDNRACSGWDEYDKIACKIETQSECEHKRSGYIKIDDIRYWTCLDCHKVNFVKDERPQYLIIEES